MDQMSRCIRCGDVIGTYEPLVVVDATGARQTSLAAEPRLEHAGGEHYHRACYESGERAGAQRPPV